MSRIDDKIKEIENFIEELGEIAPEKFEEYASSNTIKAASERYVERIVEAITDVAFLIIKNKKFEIPEDDIDAFRILSEHKIINEEIYKKLKLAKGMRNIIAHEYGKIDDRVVFEAIKDELGKDAEKFLGEVEKVL